MVIDDIPALIRRCRSRGNLSQRELAAVAGVSAAAVARIETGELVPSLRTIDLFDAAGLRLTVVKDDGSEIEIDDPSDQLMDRGGRRYPAHLKVREVGPKGEGWWGQRNVMPWIRPRPAHTFTRYRPSG